MAISAVILLLALAVRRAAAACAADNCYNQISRHGSAFCSTYTTTVNTNTGAIPTYVSSSCGFSRVSSACSCLLPASTCTGAATTVTVTSVSTVTISTTTPSATPRIQNGDFPGLYPWFNGDIINESSYNYNTPVVTSPGYSGGYSALFSFDADGIYELDQYVTLPSTPSTLYLSFYAMSPSGSGCFIIAGFGARGSSGVQKQFSLSTTWTQYQLRGTTDGSTSGFVALVMQCGSGSNNKIYVDSISLA